MAGESGAPTSTGRAIFISYRRDDSEGEAGRLYDDLVRAYGEASIFMDVAGIQPGLDFRKAIDDNVASCGVLLAVIGPTWATIAGKDGARRLDNPEDYVRLEIGSALKRGIAVIPVLVHEAKMPVLDQLPEELKDLRYRNSVELTHTRWNSDVELLIGALKSYVHVTPAKEGSPVHATVPVQLPAPQTEPREAPAPKKSSLPLLLGIGFVLLMVGVLGVFWWMHNGSGTQQQAQPQPVSGGGSGTGGGSPIQPALPAAAQAMLGRWQNSRMPSGGDDLAQISVVNFGGQILVEAWGQCAGHLCNWGSRKGTVQGTEVVTGAWQLRNTPKEAQMQRSAALSLQAVDGGLQVTIKNHYEAQNGRDRDIVNQFQFSKMP